LDRDDLLGHRQPAGQLRVFALETRDAGLTQRVNSALYEVDDHIVNGSGTVVFRYAGADGIKTGHTEEAGYSLLASVHRDNRRVVLVLGGLPTMRARAQESERLIEWAFREFNDYRLLGAGEKVDDAEVWLGTQAKVPLMIATDLVGPSGRGHDRPLHLLRPYELCPAAGVASQRAVLERNRARADGV